MSNNYYCSLKISYQVEIMSLRGAKRRGNLSYWDCFTFVRNDV